ncbi:RNA methyltransferase tRNA(m5U54)methyltransferase [Mycoemilia scoparia]|uniref:tRNA (guanine(26)-N(2))-dimethyltransferase n=1 Tax=Mycoemilia scoparia TaxID=417184 RepID=A0A9W8A1W3_9FUNG|nr:RNA methyltransferase tRNA(m5U54)methyltransferase [Mycoemilia scoparia]
MVEATKVTYNEVDYQKISEGKANILFPTQNEVFYNPVQQFNRDMSIAAIKTWRDIMKEEVKDRWDKKKIRNTTLAASGLRSIRYAKEIDGVKKIIANDLADDAVESIRRNVHYNELDPNLVVANKGDAISVLYQHREHDDQFDVVDLDPYGSAVPFIDGAIQAVKNGGLICVTCTDLAILASMNHPETCFAKYGGNPLKSEFCHELALRLVVNCLQTSAARYKRIVVPVLSCSIDFYVRLFVRVYESPIKVKSVASNTGIVYHCPSCYSFKTQPLGISKSLGGGKTKYSVAQGPNCDPRCENCGSHTHIGGPCWIGPLHDKTFVERMYNHVSESKELYKTQPRMQGMLKVIHEELDIPFHYSISSICSAARATNPTLLEFRTKVDFTLHPDANPESRKIKLVRFQQNPEKFWGPKARHRAAPKRSRSESDGPEKKQKQ